MEDVYFVGENFYFIVPERERKWKWKIIPFLTNAACSMLREMRRDNETRRGERERKESKEKNGKKYCSKFEIYIYITVGSTAFYLQLVSSLMTIADLRARSRDMHRYIRLASCSRLPSFYTYPRIHAIHDTFRADTYVLTNTDNTPCRRGESAKRREIERERERE